MSIDACAGNVQQGDPDRFLSAMIAPLEQRGRLMVLYAFNLEVARAPWVTQEPIIAEMRLQFWLDVLNDIAAGKPGRAHEVAGPLADLIASHDVPTTPLVDLVEARRFDIYREPHKDTLAFERYIEATAGNLMWAAALALGAEAQHEQVIRDYAYGAGLTALFKAVPALERAGRAPLVDGRVEAVRSLAEDGLRRMDKARSSSVSLPRSVLPALWAGWQSRAVLNQARRDPMAVADGRLGQSELRRRGGLLIRSLTGRV